MTPFFATTITIAKGEQILLRELRDGLGRSLRPQRVGMLAEKRAAQNVACDGRELFFLVANAGELHFFFPCDGLFGHRRVEQNIAEQLRPESQIGLCDVERNAEAVIARIASQVAPDRFDRVGNLLRGAGRSSLSPAPWPSGE